jgi:hypothetical protein
MNYDFINELKAYGEKQKLSYRDGLLDNYLLRKNGKRFSLNEHLEKIIYSLLSCNRPWEPIGNNKENIKSIFFDFDADKIYSTPSDYFIKKIKEIKCGNISIKAQMKGLRDIIDMLKTIDRKYGSIDNYFDSRASSVQKLVFELSDKPYKLKNMGIPLVCEYLKSAGIDAAKPDTHIKRMLGKDFLGFSQNQPAKTKEALRIMEKIAQENHITQTEVDRLMWWYCADGYWEICTLQNPKCEKCVIKKYCCKEK